MEADNEKTLELALYVNDYINFVRNNTNIQVPFPLHKLKKKSSQKGSIEASKHLSWYNTIPSSTDVSSHDIRS